MCLIRLPLFKMSLKVLDNVIRHETEMRHSNCKSKCIYHIVDYNVRQYVNVLGKLELTNFSEVHGCTSYPKISKFSA